MSLVPDHRYWMGGKTFTPKVVAIEPCSPCPGNSKQAERLNPEPAEPRDFGEILRHESSLETRLETIATLAVRMRETVRRRSEEWESKSEKVGRELVERHP
jgi:hypothetical protein